MHSSAPPPVSLVATLRSINPGASPSEAWRAAACALVRVSSREHDALAALFEEEAVSDDIRSLVLDLLAGAGTYEAQVVMRKLLALAIARRDARTFASFVQRLGFVAKPDGPTLRFLMSVYAESRSEAHEVRAACAYALGAAAGQAFLAGDGDAAGRASDGIRKDLLAAGSVQEKCALVTALGNAGLPSDAAAILRFTNDADANVRASSALALRKVATKETRRRLVQLLADRELKVATSAITALADQRLGEADIDLACELVLGGRTNLALDASILRLVVAQRPEPTGRGSVVENALRLLIGRADPIAPPRTESGERRAIAPGTKQMFSRDELAAARAFPPPTTPASWTTAQRQVVPRPSQAPTAPPPQQSSGEYRMVADEGRRQLESLGLDPNGKGLSQMIPPPPKKQPLNRTVLADSSYPAQIAASAPRLPVPHALVRRAR